MLNVLLGKYVKLGTGGGGGCEGHLVVIEEDYLSLYTEDGVFIHYQHSYVNSVTEIVSKSATKPQLDDSAAELIESFPTMFWEIVQSLQGQKIRVDDGSRTAVGVLVECGDDFLKLETNPDEMAWYFTLHIRSVCLARNRVQGERGDPPRHQGRGKDRANRKGQGKGPRRGKPHDRSGDDTSGDDTSGDDTSGDDTSGDDTGGDERSGEERHKEEREWTLKVRDGDVERVYYHPPILSDRENV